MEHNTLTGTQKKEIDEVFFSLGLQTNEQAVYLALLSNGPTTLTPLGQILALPITTIQSIITRLDERGLIITTKNKSRNVYAAASPKILKKKLEAQIKEVEAITPFLEALTAPNNKQARVSVYYRERVSEILNQVLDSKEKIIYEIVAAADFQNLLGEKFHFTKRRVAKNIHLKSLRVESREIKKYSSTIDARELREAKFLPKELHFKASIFLWGDTVAIFSTKEEGLALVINSRSVKEMWQQQFELLWSLGRKM